MSVTNYSVVVGNGPADLAANVLTAIGNGYQPVGNAYQSLDGKHLQPMILGVPAGAVSSVTTEPGTATPTAGQTVAISPGSISAFSQIITPAGTLATLTVTAANGTQAGQELSVTFSQVITAITWGGGNFAATGLALPTAITLGQMVLFAWSATASKWVRIQ